MPNIDRARIVREAREHVGTPYAHQHRLKGVACDCAGVILSIGQCSRSLSITPEDLAPWLKYSATPNPRFLKAWLTRFYVPSPVPPSELAPDGSIALLGWRPRMGMHLGLIATLQGRRTLIHSAQPFGKCTEHALDRDWRSKVQGWWDYPGVE